MWRASTVSVVVFFVSAALFVSGCSDYPPGYGYVEPPLPPARSDLSGIEVGESMAVPVVFTVNDKSKFSGESAGTSALVLDPTIARIISTTRDATVHDGGPAITGHVFLVYGVAPGETQIQVFQDGEDKGTLPLTVVAQQQ
jgi:hypothetical protein